MILLAMPMDLGALGEHDDIHAKSWSSEAVFHLPKFVGDGFLGTGPASYPAPVHEPAQQHR